MSSISPDIVTDGLVVCLDAADKKSYSGSGTTWYDRSGEDNDGTLINGANFDSEAGGCIALDGVNDYVQLYKNNTTELTLIGWAKFTGASWPSYAGIISKDISGDRIYQLNWTWGKLQSHLGAGITASEATPLNTWIHFGFTSSSSGGSVLYRNAQVVGTNGSSISANASDIPITIGAFNNYNASGGSKLIADSLIYDRAISAAEVLQNFNAMKSRFGIT